MAKSIIFYFNNTNNALTLKLHLPKGSTSLVHFQNIKWNIKEINLRGKNVMQRLKYI